MGCGARTWGPCKTHTPCEWGCGCGWLWHKVCVTIIFAHESSRLLFPLHLLYFSLLLQLAFATNPTAWSCKGSANFTPSGTYNKNMNNLMSYLDSNTPLTGFSNGSMGLNPNRVYGLALCRGDINATDCQACVDEASNEIQRICPFKEEAFIWCDYCQLKYSNADNSDWRVASSPITVSDPAYFSQMLIQLLTLLVEDAYVSPKLYAAGAMAIGNLVSESIYGLVQCTRDLSSVNCKSCIDVAIEYIPQYLFGRQGGKLMDGSCNLCFEIYPFVMG